MAPNMNIKDFLHFNKNCPLCQNPLSLYMQWSTSNKLFISSNNNVGIYKFEEHSSNDRQLNLKFDNNIKISMILEENENDYKIYFNSFNAERKAKEQEIIYFYYLCNPGGIKVMDPNYTGGELDYEINIYEGCYYRSSPFIKFKYDNNKFKFSSYSTLLNRDESFVIKSKINSLEKIYIISLNYEEDKTIFWYYTVSDDQKEQENYEPNIFEKEMPLLNVRPNFDPKNRENLLNRFDNWIMYS